MARPADGSLSYGLNIKALGAPGSQFDFRDLSNPAAAKATYFRRRETSFLQHVGQRAGVEHLFVMGAGVHHVAEARGKKKARDKSVGGHGIGGIRKIVAHENAQIGHDDSHDAARLENAKTLPRYRNRLLVGKAFEGVGRIDARNRRIRKRNALANIGAAHVAWPIRSAKNPPPEGETREQDAGRIVDIHPSLDPRGSTTDVQLQFAGIGHVSIYRNFLSARKE